MDMDEEEYPRRTIDCVVRVVRGLEARTTRAVILHITNTRKTATSRGMRCAIIFSLRRFNSLDNS